jgi:hypothetical protein
MAMCAPSRKVRSGPRRAEGARTLFTDLSSRSTAFVTSNPEASTAVHLAALGGLRPRPLGRHPPRLVGRRTLHEDEPDLVSRPLTENMASSDGPPSSTSAGPRTSEGRHAYPGWYASIAARAVAPSRFVWQPRWQPDTAVQTSSGTTRASSPPFPSGCRTRRPETDQDVVVSNPTTAYHDVEDATSTGCDPAVAPRVRIERSPGVHHEHSTGYVLAGTVCEWAWTSTAVGRPIRTSRSTLGSAASILRPCECSAANRTTGALRS